MVEGVDLKDVKSGLGRFKSDGGEDGGEEEDGNGMNVRESRYL